MNYKQMLVFLDKFIGSFQQTVNLHLRIVVMLVFLFIGLDYVTATEEGGGKTSVCKMDSRCATPTVRRKFLFKFSKPVSTVLVK